MAVSIVAHGIFGSSYRREVVLDAGLSDNDQASLYDVRHLLSFNYDNDAPMAGWALQPAPSGIWLSYIRRTFDSHYHPAYIMVSFLFPFGARLSPNALSLIDHSLCQNEHKFSQRGVVLSHPDWSFLSQLESSLAPLCSLAPQAPHYQWQPPQRPAAYWPRNASDLLANLWDPRLRRFKIVFCGSDIVNAAHVPTSIDDVNSDDVADPTPSDAPLPPSHEDPVQCPPNSDTPAVDSPGHKSHHHGHKSHHHGHKSRNKKSTRVLLLLGLSVLVVKSCGPHHSDNNIDSSRVIGEAVVSAVDTTPTPDSAAVNSAAVDSVAVNSAALVDSIMVPDTSVVEPPADPPNVKISISSSKTLFQRLTWEYVERNGRKFYAVYDVTNDSMSKRVKQIIRMANEVGERTYNHCYHRVWRDVDADLHHHHDPLYYLERLLERAIGDNSTD